MNGIEDKVSMIMVDVADDMRPAREEVMRIWLKVELDLLSHSWGYQNHSDLLQDQGFKGSQQ